MLDALAAETQAAEMAAGETRLPPGWKVVRLGEVSDLTMGQSPPSHSYNREGIGSPFLQGKADFTQLYPEPTSYCTQPLKIAKRGSVLVSVRAPVGDTNLADRTYVIGRGLAAVDLRQGDSFFLFYLLTHNKARIASLGSGTTFQSINKTVLERLAVCLPPLREQRAIARVLRTVQEAREARRREVALERERKAALMQHLFTHGTRGEPASIKATRFGPVPEHWRIMPLAECATVQTGVAKGRRFGSSQTVSLPYLRVANVQDGYLDLSEIKYIDIRPEEVERYSLHNGDILLTEGGDSDKLGRGFIWRDQVPNCVHQNHIFAVRPTPALMTPEYFAYLVQSSYGKAYFLNVAHRTTNLASINSTKLKAFPTLVPDLQEQELIVSSLQSVDDKLSSLERETAVLDEAFRALLEEVMTGRVLVGGTACD